MLEEQIRFAIAGQLTTKRNTMNIRKSRRSGDWHRGFASYGRTIKILTLTLGCTGAACVLVWMSQRALATTDAFQRQTDLALADTINALLVNSACPNDLATIQATATLLLPIMHPELGQFAQAQDAAALDAQAARNSSILNPAEEHASRMADPAYRDHFASALAEIQFGVVQEGGQ